MKKLSQTLLIILLLSAGVAKAQTGADVYEYATIASTSITAKPALYVSFSNGEYKEVEVDKNEAKPCMLVNQTAALKYIAQMSKEGWEVINSQINSNAFSGTMSWCYFLKRKLK